MYPHYLCLHLASSRLCRQLIGQYPPQGFVKVIRHAQTFRMHSKLTHIAYYSKLKISPYQEDGELSPKYWSLPRVDDLIRRYNA